MRSLRNTVVCITAVLARDDSALKVRAVSRELCNCTRSRSRTVSGPNESTRNHLPLTVAQCLMSDTHHVTKKIAVCGFHVLATGRAS
jgi:hypothetical protein